MRKRRERRKLSMTSLIDVIFLLLLFFMLTSTFTRFAEVELTAAGSSGVVSDGPPPVFLKLGETDLSVNLRGTLLSELAEALNNLRADVPILPVLVSIDDSVSAQRLTDLLVTLRSVPGLSTTVLGAT